MKSARVSNFAEWKERARDFFSKKTCPSDIEWLHHGQTSLFSEPEVPRQPSLPSFSVSKEFLTLAQHVACHTDEDRWSLLYRLLWRLGSNRHLLRVATDPDVSKALLLQKGVRRDVHKMHAFVRFAPEKTRYGEEQLLAWYEPLYSILEIATPFFVRRFGASLWKIITPSGSASWDKNHLTFDFNETLKPSRTDCVDELWKDYYGSIFNPARLNLRAMMKEMPQRSWKNLPEATLISKLIAEAPRRIDRMKVLKQEAQVPSLPPNGSPQQNLHILAQASMKCTGCPLFESASQVVFGEGPSHAKVVFVGEQPGDEEDKRGRPFVGPAGKLLDEVFSEAGIDRTSVYVTNAVKHFKHEERGKRRLHKRPNSSEVHSCRSWLRSEISIVNPELIVCLGATAAQSVLGRAIKISEERGRFQQGSDGRTVFITLHPSSILRTDESVRPAVREGFLRDLRRARMFYEKRSSA
jgi:uracil-DNA glycosylase